MFNEDGSLVCIFNGEIYNFQTLREELIAAGHTFATRSDTEVLLHGYEQWGNQLPGKLRGMFTFVIWDQKTKTMFGARDIFGIKPFYYYNQDGLFLFGSEIKSFLAHPGFKKELNEERLPEYLSIEYIPNEETMFKNVYKLPSGCMFTWENGELTVERYYEIKYHVDDSKSLEEWEKIITDTFAESVAAHQIADVEVGCFLSSGVDSSFVVNEVAKGTPHVKSFSVGYAEEKYSELPYAQEFSKEIGVPSIANKVDALPLKPAFPVFSQKERGGIMQKADGKVSRRLLNPWTERDPIQGWEFMPHEAFSLLIVERARRIHSHSLNGPPNCAGVFQLSGYEDMVG